MLAEQLALGLIRLEFGLEVTDIDDSADLGPEVLGELVGDRILVEPLGVSGDKADANLFTGVERVRKNDLSRLKP